MNILSKCRASRALVVVGIAAFLSLGLSSCQKDPAETEEKIPVRFNVHVDVAQTKAPVTNFEDFIRSVDILVFKAEGGALDAKVRYTYGADFSMSVTKDRDLVWYVIANAPEGRFDAIATKAALEAERVLMTDNTATSLVMFQTGTMHLVGGDDPIEVLLKRYCSKVTVKNLELTYRQSFVTPPVMKLRRIALVNAAADILYSGVPGTSAWYNKMAVDASLPTLVQGMLVAGYGDYVISSSSAFGVTEPLYVMPNAVSNTVNSLTSTEWSPRSTRVAVEILIDDVSNWYVVDLPAMEPNTHYIINKLTVLGPGSPGPDQPAQRDDILFGITIEPWGTATENTEFPVS